MPDWLQELAALTTVALAGGWLVLRWFRIGQPRAQPSCARCAHNPGAPATTGTRGVRSTQLRVID